MCYSIKTQTFSPTKHTLREFARCIVRLITICSGASNSQNKKRITQAMVCLQAFCSVELSASTARLLPPCRSRKACASSPSISQQQRSSLVPVAVVHRTEQAQRDTANWPCAISCPLAICRPVQRRRGTVRLSSAPLAFQSASYR